MAAAAPGGEFLLKSCGFLARPGVYLAGGKHTAGCSDLFRVELWPGGEGHRQYQARKLRSGQHPGWHSNSGNAIGQIRNHSGASADRDIAADADLLDKGGTDANPAALSHMILTGDVNTGANMYTVGELHVVVDAAAGIEDGIAYQRA